MIFNKITLKNFRQYRGENVLSFSHDDGSQINLIIAPNGVGKTTFSQAVIFCFYGENKLVFKLPKNSCLLNNSLIEDMSLNGKEELSVKVNFFHNNKNYMAVRKIIFEKTTHGIRKFKQSFSLWVEKIGEGYTECDNDIRQMMPIGLAHIYMFDGERIEKPISNPEFRKDLHKSIVGVLGLNKLEQALSFLGDDDKPSTVIGKVHKKIKATTSSEERVKKEVMNASLRNEELNDQINKINPSIDRLNRDIKDLQEKQSKINAIKDLRIRLNRDKEHIKSKRREESFLVDSGNELAFKCFLLLELAKTKKKYDLFKQKRNEDDLNNKSLYSNLHESVIKDIIEKNICICGRKITPENVRTLTSLSVLPHDNAVHLNYINDLYKNIYELPQLFQQLNKKSLEISNVQYEIESLEKKCELLSDKIQEKESEEEIKEIEKQLDKTGNDVVTNYQNQIKNIISHRDKRLMTVNNKEEEIRKNNVIISSNKSKMDAIYRSNIYNKKVNDVVQELRKLKNHFSKELSKNKEIAKNSIQQNMNYIVGKVMRDNYNILLDDKYSMKIIRRLDDYMTEETDILSTGQNIVIYLSFLRALFQTIKDFNFNDASKNGVIMDAALSKLDEKHTMNASKYILNSFDQLIFLSYKGQLSNELLSGISSNIGSIYELNKNSYGNVSVNKIDNITDYLFHLERK
ncbi:AAA family ATPase [Apilactobacillus xinyiensis]|uniref:AAA family ATPase n=1 Tax=Apilactobacillus xinyiensis TaxID=2841032 RepID=UPI001C7DB414|nr:AAA family ATPase [Apilactobacillus xinyiensis]